jgi:hypothetical protein
MPYLAPILDRLHIKESAWLDAVQGYDRKFGHIVGSASRIAEKASRSGRRWFRGVSSAMETFN